MKITVGDVMNSKSDVRDYLSVHPENGRIFVDIKCFDIVLIDKTQEWDELKEENKSLREALEFYAGRETYKDDRQHTSTGELVHTGYTRIQCDSGKKARKALEESK